MRSSGARTWFIGGSRCSRAVFRGRGVRLGDRHVLAYTSSSLSWSSLSLSASLSAALVCVCVFVTSLDLLRTSFFKRQILTCTFSTALVSAAHEEDKLRRVLHHALGSRIF
jgi:hypothetical protein